MKEKMDKKKSIQFIFISYVIFLIILIAIMASSLFTVSYGIFFESDEIDSGQNVTLNYNVKNNLFFVEINGILFEYWIEQNLSTVLNETKINLPNINAFNNYEDDIIIPTYGLEKGDYKIWTQLTYSIGAGKKGIGNREALLLSWDITVK